ncbi:hypothetical protein [Nodosilinea sp. LEGE 07298]|uniref:hypothetical protein n=1 Tax=Nodosilinea sp. LEGE 07298 TaxID=2777970 RepID=UPI001D144DF0|nr:hypothetical protein [Nodosilinea sp. LEGE 07298]
MKNLTAEVRRKAIDIANALLGDGYEDGRAIAIATAQAEKWAKRRDKQIAKKNTGGTTGQAVAPESEKGDGEAIHVVCDPDGVHPSLARLILRSSHLDKHIAVAALVARYLRSSELLKS